MTLDHYQKAQGIGLGIDLLFEHLLHICSELIGLDIPREVEFFVEQVRDLMDIHPGLLYIVEVSTNADRVRLRVVG